MTNDQLDQLKEAPMFSHRHDVVARSKLFEVVVGCREDVGWYWMVQTTRLGYACGERGDAFPRWTASEEAAVAAAADYVFKNHHPRGAVRWTSIDARIT